jgi:DNA-binding MarR family transcriptional regulator
MVVRLVGRHPGITPGDLARFLHLHPSTLTAVLKRLVQRKVLLRKADSSDARRGRLTLAARGVALDGVQRGTVEAAVKAALDHVAPRDVRTASAVLELVKQALERPARGESWGAVSGERAWTGPAPASEVALAAGGARRRG